MLKTIILKKWNELQLDNRTYYSLIVFIGILIFGQTLKFGFVDIDDHKHIVENTLITAPSFSNIASFWKQAYFSLYIPFTYTVWAVLGILSISTNLVDPHPMPNPVIFHLVNLALHILNTVLVFHLLSWMSRMLGDKQENTQTKYSILLCSLVFLLHPLQSQTVGWVSCLKDLLATFFILSALISFLEYRSVRMATVFHVLAVLSKPMAVTVPLMIFAFSFLFLKEKPKRAILSILPMLLVSLFIGVFTQQLQPSSLNLQTLALPSRVVVALDSFGFYISKIIAPFALTMDYGRNPKNAMDSTDLYLYVVIAIVSLFALYRSRQKTPLIFLGGVFVGLSYLPILGIIPFNFQKFSTVANHYTYLSFFGIAIILFSLGRILPRKFTQAGLIGILFFSGLASFVRVQDFRNTETLLIRNLKLNPQSFLSHNNLAVYYVHNGRLPEAEEHFQSAIEITPEEPALLGNLAAVQIGLQKPDAALANLKKWVALSPDSALARYRLGTFLATLKEEKEALFQLEEARKIEPQNPQILAALRTTLKE